MTKNISIQQQRKIAMSVPYIRLSVAMLGMSITPILLAANLKDLDVVSLPGEKVELKLVFDGPVPAPKGYSIDQPARIALDLPNVTSLLNQKRRTIGIGNVRNLAIVQAKNVTRLVVDLNTLVPYVTRAEGNNIFITLGDSAKKSITPVNSSVVTSRKPVSTSQTTSNTSIAKPAVVTPPPVASNAANITKPFPTPINTKKVTTPSIANSAINAIQNVDFRRGDNGEGNVVIKLSNSTISPDVQEQGSKIILNFPKTQLPEALRVRLDVKDFATPVQFVSSTAQTNGSTITIEPKGNFDYLVYQADDELTVSVKHVSAEDKQRRLEDQGVFKGDTLSLNFQDIEVRSVLQILADFTKLNLVATDSVTGNITLRLQNVPWDQALDIIMRTRGLAKRQEGNILIIAPAAELAESARQIADAQKTIEATQPLRRELIQINYADASAIIALFQATMSRTTGFTGSQSANGVGSYSATLATDDRGSLTADKRTNTIIAYQTEERLEELRRIVAQLDRPVRQVQIEARVVEANVDFSKNLGVRWALDIASNNQKWVSYGGADGRLNMNDNSGSSTSSGKIGTSIIHTGDEKGQHWTVPGGSPMVDLGASSATSGFGIGYLGKNVFLDLKLNAMQKSGQGEIISQPKVTTSDKEVAKIMKGQEVPYQEASSSGSTSTSFKDAVLSLEVKPQITPDNQIIMDVTVTKDSVAQDQAYLGVPAINKNEVKAKVLVADGETIVLGGVFENTQSKVSEKVPYLGDLPLLGRLFRRDQVSNTKQELLVFLTPRIIDSKAFATR